MVRTRIAVNGFGRIGRCVTRAWLSGAHPDIDIVAVNDIMPAVTAAHLLKHDSVHGVLQTEISLDGDRMIIGDKKLKMTHHRDPSDAPWNVLGVDVVIEATGIFTTRSQALSHVKGGAPRVLITGPSENADATVVLGVNEQTIPRDALIVSNASCSTNCLAVVLKVLDELVGVEAAMMSTVHAYTADQSLVDMPHSDLRRARAAGLSIIPTATGAAKALSKVLPTLAPRLAGVAIRVPTPNVSLLELVVLCKTDASIERVNAFFRQRSKSDLQQVLGYCDQPLVSVDFLKRTESAVFDATQTQMASPRMLRIAAWYDNEWGFSNRVLNVAAKLPHQFSSAFHFETKQE